MLFAVKMQKCTSGLVCAGPESETNLPRPARPPRPFPSIFHPHPRLHSLTHTLRPHLTPDVDLLHQFPGALLTLALRSSPQLPIARRSMAHISFPRPLPVPPLRPTTRSTAPLPQTPTARPPLPPSRSTLPVARSQDRLNLKEPDSGARSKPRGEPNDSS